MSSPFFIGIAGPSGAGKTTLAKHLLERFPNRVTHVRLDAFFKDVNDFPQFGKWINRESPENLYWDDFFTSLQKLKSGRAIQIPQYDRATGAPCGIEQLEPREIILVEGYLLYFDPRVRDLIDVRLFLHTSVEQQYARKKSRWPDMDDEYFYQVVVPMFDMHGSHGARHAHAVLNGDQNEEEILLEFITSPSIRKILESQINYAL